MSRSEYLADLSIKSYNMSSGGQVRVFHDRWENRDRYSKIIIEVPNNPERRAEVAESIVNRVPASTIELLARAGPRFFLDHMIPNGVAVEGQAVRAAYIYSFQGHEKEQIADLFSVTEKTIEQYLSDVVNNRR